MKSKRFIIIILIVMVLSNIASFTIGRYDIQVFEHKPYLYSYKDLYLKNINCRIILMDILEEIYELDGSYFYNVIEETNSYKKLQQFYKDNENDSVNWTWDLMYNL